ncbi:PREDICTED: BURP domain protein USPL1-like [Camelina sativa]|uniref:BURP domain protein USPL1-like n=1 Tax=Camelina sativa TaxID=90675 RepID=A0ABM0YGB8_CAMSA|nr:PREDICTED: BURP domain protein USPL1-like [Camelina sativa]
MASTLRLSNSFIILLLFSLWVVEAHTSRKLISIKEQQGQDLNHFLKDGDFDDPSLYVYFRLNDLKLGTRLRIYFYKNDLQKLPPLLTRQQADRIPFTKSKLNFLLDHFSISKDSPQGKAVKATLGHCGAKEIEGEHKFCGTSLESMVDLVKKTLGSNVDLKVMTSKIMAPTRDPISYGLYNYTFVEAPKELVGIKMLGCHRMPYPYAVYYCHGHKGGSRLFEVNMVTDDGKQRVLGPAICHMDTSMWDVDHVAFKVLKMEPRSGPVCHFFPLDNIVWVTK